MEADTGRICSGSGRVGMWFTYVDSATTSAIAPVTTGAALPELMTTPRGTSNYAMHMRGYYSTYAGIAIWLNKSAFSGSTGVYNASGYTGIKFYAKGSGGILTWWGRWPRRSRPYTGGPAPWGQPAPETPTNTGNCPRRRGR